MRLRKPCEHDRYEKHWIAAPAENSGALCPGGEFLPEDAALKRASRALYDFVAPIGVGYAEGMYLGHVEVVLDALADQVGEPG